MLAAETTQGHGDTLRALKRAEEAKEKFGVAVDLATRAIEGLSSLTSVAELPEQRVALSTMFAKRASMYEALGEL